MGSILTFVANRRSGLAGRMVGQAVTAAGQPPGHAGGADATVIIFPGVRYERTVTAERAALTEQPAT